MPAELTSLGFLKQGEIREKDKSRLLSYFYFYCFCSYFELKPLVLIIMTIRWSSVDSRPSPASKWDRPKATPFFSTLDSDPHATRTCKISLLRLCLLWFYQSGAQALLRELKSVRNLSFIVCGVKNRMESERMADRSCDSCRPVVLQLPPWSLKLQRVWLMPFVWDNPVICVI